jgi:hypothetical protein
MSLDKYVFNHVFCIFAIGGLQFDSLSLFFAISDIRYNVLYSGYLKTVFLSVKSQINLYFIRNNLFLRIKFVSSAIFIC